MFELFVGLIGLVVTVMVIVAIFDIRKLLAAILKELRARPLTALLAALMLSTVGCVPALTSGGAAVKDYWRGSAVVVGCEDLGIVQAPGAYGGYMTNTVKNAAAARRANVVLYQKDGARGYKCDSTRQTEIPKQVVLDELALAPYLLSGSGSIAGQAFLKTRGGDVKYGAGNVITLEPAADYFAALNLQEQKLHVIGPDAEDWWVPAPGQDWKRYRRETQADGEGRFSFMGLPPGKYFARTKIEWYVPSTYGGHQSGGWVGKEVVVADGARSEVILSPPALPAAPFVQGLGPPLP